MIIFIIFASLLLLGIISFILKILFNHLYHKWCRIEKKYAPDLETYHWNKHVIKYDKNPEYNKEKYLKAKKKVSFYIDIYYSNVFFYIGIFGCLIGGLFSLIIGICQLQVNFSQSSKIKYLNMLETRSAYVRELENNFQNEHLYKDIADFNNELRTVKMGYENPWFSWFYNPLIANNIDYIEVEDYDNKT